MLTMQWLLSRHNFRHGTSKAATVDTASQAYRAARIYNSGRVDPSGDLGKGIATHCYASDVANRLTGWVHAKSTCTLDEENLGA